MPPRRRLHLISCKFKYGPRSYGPVSVLDILRYLPPPRDPGRPTAPAAKKNCGFCALQSSFSNDLCAHVADFRRELAGFNVEILDFEIDFRLTNEQRTRSLGQGLTPYPPTLRVVRHQGAYPLPPYPKCPHATLPYPPLVPNPACFCLSVCVQGRLCHYILHVGLSVRVH